MQPHNLRASRLGRRKGRRKPARRAAAKPPARTALELLRIALQRLPA
jgi:hypothetical protein